MNKLVIIGNGFDLAHGLKTSYKDFILWYLNKTVFDKEIKQDERLIYLDNYNYSNQIKEIKTIQDFFNFIEKYRIKVSYKHQFLDKIINHQHNKRWVDIENEYFLSLRNVYVDYEKTDVLKENELYNLNYCFDRLKVELEIYLKSLEQKDINEELKNTLIDVNKDNFNSTQEIMILNFNYTTTIEQYKNIFDGKTCEIRYIHGKLDDIENPIIFGYGDESNEYFEKIENVNNNELTRHLKSFLYLTTNNYKILFNFLHQGRFRVYVLGHSLGLSDRLLLNNIFEHEKFELIKLYFYQHKKGDDFFHKTQELSRHFKLNSKHLMRTKVIPYKNSKPLIPYKLKK